MCKTLLKETNILVDLALLKLLLYFIDYAITVVPFPPLCPPPPAPAQSLRQYSPCCPCPWVIDMDVGHGHGHVYVFFGYSISYAVLYIPMTLL